MKIRNTQLSQIWNHLGDFWGKFEDKDTIENWWESFNSLVSDLYKKSYWTHYSKSIKYLSPIISGLDFYLPVYYGDTIPNLSGLLNINVSGEYNPQIGAIADIGNLINIYYESESVPFAEEELVENTNYTISANKEYITFVDYPDTDPFTATANQSNVNYGLLYMSGVSIVNPFLFNYWGRIANVDIDLYLDSTYNNYVTTVNGIEYTQIQKDLTFYKYFIWSLIYLRKKAYTFDTIENLLGIVYGFPFAYESGLVTDISALGMGHTITISGEIGEIVYSLDEPLDNFIAVSEADEISSFQLLVSGFEYNDYISDSGLICTYASGEVDRYSTTVITIPDIISGTLSEANAISGLIESVIPEGLLVYHHYSSVTFSYLEEESSIVFEDQYKTSTSPAKVLYLSNITNQPLSNITYTLSNSNAFSYGAVPTDLAASGEIVIPVEFSPYHTYSYTSDLTVDYEINGITYSSTFTNIVSGMGLVRPQWDDFILVAMNGDDGNDGTWAGGAVKTIATGIALATVPGKDYIGTVYIREGTFDAQLKDIFPSGATCWESGLTLASYPGETAELKPTAWGYGIESSDNPFYVINVGSGINYLRFEDLTLNALYAGDYGVAAVISGGAHNIIFSGCTFIGDIEAFTECPVVASFATDNHFQDCIICSGNDNGLYLGSDSSGTFTSGIIENCTFYTFSGSAIRFNNDGTEPLIQNTIIRNNVIWDTGDYALGMAGASGTHIYNNVMYDCYQGIYFGDHDQYDIKFYNNTINHTTVGTPVIYIHDSYSHNLEIINNIVADLEGAWATPILNLPASVTPPASATITYNFIGGGLPFTYDSSNITSGDTGERDPGFVDADLNIYTLNPLSCCVGSATATVSGIRSTDFYGRDPGTDNWDIGAFEFRN